LYKQYIGGIFIMSDYVAELSGEGDFDGFTSAGVTLVDFWASWCGPCKAIAPIVEEIARDFTGKIKVGKVNVDDAANRETAKKFGIMSIPTLIIFKDGAIAEKIVGMRNKAFLVEVINKNI